MASTRSTRAIIVGAGIGGLTAAIALRQAGIDAAVFERASEQRKLQFGPGIDLWSNAIRALQQIGMDQKVAAAGSVVERFEFRTSDDRLLAAWPIGELGRKLGSPTVGVARADVLPVLSAALDDGVIHFGARAVGFRQDADGVTVRFADGAEERGDLVIGADGIESTIRAQLHGQSKPRYAGYQYWQGFVDFHHEKIPDHELRAFWGRGSRFVFLHVGGGRLFWMGIANAAETDRDPTGETKATVRAHYRGWPEPIDAIVEATDEKGIRRMGTYDRDPLTTWGEGRVTLLGDSAHPMTFNVGQGAGQAIEGAVQLAKCLGRSQSVVAALREYEALRLPRTTKMMKRARGIGKMGMMDNPVICGGRNMVMRTVFRGPAWKDHSTDLAYEVH